MTDQIWRRSWRVAAGLFGAAAVALGAYAAHGLSGHEQELAEKASHFALLHALALLALSQGARPLCRMTKAAGSFFILGVLLFCGALTLLGLTPAAAAPVAPFGGSSFILGWLLLALSGLRKSPSGV